MTINFDQNYELEKQRSSEDADDQINFSGESRRRFATSGLAVSGIILTLASRPVLGDAFCMSPSGFISGNTSQHGACPAAVTAKFITNPDETFLAAFPKSSQSYNNKRLADMLTIPWPEPQLPKVNAPVEVEKGKFGTPSYMTTSPAPLASNPSARAPSSSSYGARTPSVSSYSARDQSGSNYSSQDQLGSNYSAQVPSASNSSRNQSGSNYSGQDQSGSNYSAQVPSASNSSRNQSVSNYSAQVPPALNSSRNLSGSNYSAQAPSVSNSSRNQSVSNYSAQAPSVSNYSAQKGNGTNNISVPTSTSTASASVIATPNPPFQTQELLQHLVKALQNARSGATPYLTAETVQSMLYEWQARGAFSPTANVNWNASEIIYYLKQTQNN